MLSAYGAVWCAEILQESSAEFAVTIVLEEMIRV
jgi:hypothetical protein